MKARQSHEGKKKTRPAGKPKKTCGAKGRMCLCGHHQKQHAGKTGRCWDCDLNRRQVGVGSTVGGTICEEFRAKPCASTSLMKNGRCAKHGGKQPSGIASQNWKTGRWAASMKHLGLRDKFYAALADPHLERTQQDVAMLDALLNNLVASFKAKAAITEAQERRLSKLVEMRQQALERTARIERHLGLWIHHSRYQAVMMGLVTILHDEIKTPEGKPDTAILARVQKRLETLMMDLAVSQAAQDEGGGDGE